MVRRKAEGMDVVAVDEFCAPFPFSAQPLLHQPCRCLDLSPVAPQVLVGCPLLSMGSAGSLAFHTHAQTMGWRSLALQEFRGRWCREPPVCRACVDWLHLHLLSATFLQHVPLSQITDSNVW